ncbi:hypothetical protein SLA2020_402090 [Shorea laevis]
MESVPLSTEERANLERSRRRGKRQRASDPPLEEALDGLSIVPEKEQPTEAMDITEASRKLERPKVSYRDKLTNAAGHEDEWKDWEEIGEGNDPLLESFEATDGETLEEGIPNAIFTKEEKEALWKPWRKAVIVKPLHYSVGYKVLCDRAKQLWSLSGTFHAIDLGFGSFLFRFSNRDDYKRVITEGPWQIGGYCVVVRRWHPNFRVDSDVIEKINVWVRIPALPIWCYNDVGMQRVGEQLGKVLKMDYATKHAVRGKYAKVCVEIDLTKKLPGVVYVDGDSNGYPVAYEGLDKICFECGWYGHRREECKLTQEKNTTQEAARPAQANELNQAGAKQHVRVPADQNKAIPAAGPKTTPPAAEVGPWMLVQRRQNRKQMPNKDSADHRSNQKGNRPNAKSMSANSFAILGEFNENESGSRRAISQRAARVNQVQGGNKSSGGSKSNGGNGIVGKNFNGELVKSIRNGGSSQATAKALNLTTKWQQKGKVVAVAEKSPEAPVKAQNLSGPGETSTAATNSMKLPKDFRVDLPNPNSIRKQRQQSKKLGRSPQVKIAFAKPASDFKGAASLKNLPPPGFHEDGGFFVFGSTQDANLTTTKDGFVSVMEVPMQQETTLMEQDTASASLSDKQQLQVNKEAMSIEQVKVMPFDSVVDLTDNLVSGAGSCTKIN